MSIDPACKSGKCVPNAETLQAESNDIEISGDIWHAQSVPDPCTHRATFKIFAGPCIGSFLMLWVECELARIQIRTRPSAFSFQPCEDYTEPPLALLLVEVDPLTTQVPTLISVDV